MDIPVHYHAARDEIMRRLEGMGLGPVSFDHVPSKGRKHDIISASFTGRDPAGHACDSLVQFVLTNDLGQILQSINSKMDPHQRSYERVRHHPPVMPAPGMALGHLSIYAPFARRLRLDHGDDAQDALREIVLLILKNKGRRLNKHPRPYDTVLDANRVDHREELAPNVNWRGRSLVLHGTILPDQVLNGIVGSPVTRVIAHPLLDDRMLITRAFSEKASAKNGLGVTVLDTEGEWIPGDRI